MALTADDILTLDELNADRYGAEKTFKLANNYYTNRMAELYKVEQKMWSHLIERFNLDVPNKLYKTKSINGIFQIVEVVRDKK